MGDSVLSYWHNMIAAALVIVALIIIWFASPLLVIYVLFNAILGRDVFEKMKL